MSAAPRALLFDLDGVLVESDEVWLRVLNSVAEELCYPPISRETFLACTGQGIEEDVRRFYPRHTIADLERCYEAHFPRHLGHLVVAPGVDLVFAALDAHGIPSAVVTNTPQPTAGRVVAHAGARPHVVVGGTDVPRAKPAPDMVLHACAVLGAPPERAWLVGDSRFDREAARAAGARFVGFGIDGDLRVDSLAELARALEAVATPGPRA